MNDENKILGSSQLKELFDQMNEIYDTDTVKEIYEATQQRIEEEMAPKPKPKGNPITKEQLIDLVRYGAVMGSSNPNWTYADAELQYETWKANLNR